MRRNFILLSLTALIIATLAGCASAPANSDDPSDRVLVQRAERLSSHHELN
jgi:hypothetical protein